MTDNAKLPPGFRLTNRRKRGKTAPFPDDIRDPLGDGYKPRWHKRAAARPRAFDPGRNYTSYDPFAPENQT